MPIATKILFFKTFILPYFDYCLSLVIYFGKVQIQRLANCYQLTIAKIFNSSKKARYEFLNADNEKLNKIFIKYNIFSLTQRIFMRLCSTGFKIFASEKPPILHSSVVFNVPDKRYNLRSIDHSHALLPKTKRSDGEYTFSYFMSKFHNKFLNGINFKSVTFSKFKTSILSNFNSYFNSFYRIIS